MKLLLVLAIMMLLVSFGVGSVVTAQSNLVNNGDFEGGFVWVANPNPLDGNTPDQIPNGWIRYETFSGGVAENSSILQKLDNGPSLPGSSSLSCGRVNGGFSGDWTVVYQDLNIDASKCSGLTLTMDVKVISHDLLAGGWSTPAFEWPVVVEIDYNTIGGGSQMWRYGWYINPPGDDGGSSPIDDPGAGLIPIFNDKQVTPGVWDSNSFDLFAELPQLGTITRIYVGGSGWNFEGQVDNVVILCEGLPPSVGGKAFPVDKTGLVLPWIALALAIAAGGTYLVRRRVHSYK